MANRSMTPAQLHDRLIQFGVSVCQSLRHERGDMVIDYFNRQLLRSGTSPAAHYAEARDAESRRDFIHKVKIALKELREASVWLRYNAALANRPEFERLLKECDELIAIFVASLKTARG